MKTFAHINLAGDIVGIGMIYFESGGLLPPVQKLVDEHGEDAGIIAYGEYVKPDSALTTVLIKTSEMPNGSVIGAFDKTFRNAFKHGGGHKVNVDMPKAKEISHEKRRLARDAEMRPLDIEATIPSKAARAEAKRQIIRDKYAAIQTDIETSTTAEQLKTIVMSLQP